MTRRIGILVDGRSEFFGLPHLVPRLRTRAAVLNPLYCDMQPLAPIPQIANAAAKRIPILLTRGITHILLLIDLEQRAECAPEIASRLKSEVIKRIPSKPALGVDVVVKVRTFENWLIADPECLKSSPAMFHDTHRISTSVANDRADQVDAQALLKDCTTKRHFNKVAIAQAICARQDPDRAALTSRSYRRFLRVIRASPYLHQSRSPV